MNPIEYNIRNQLTDELVRMVRDESEEYTEEALKIAGDELRRRGFSPENLISQRDEADDDADDPADEAPKARPAANPNMLSQLRSGTLDRNALLELLLTHELEYIETYEAISDFVGSMNIRCGEYQGTLAVIKKMDLDNFILFAEDTNEEGGMAIIGCVGVGKSELTDRLEEIARKKGYVEAEESPFEGYPF